MKKAAGIVTLIMLILNVIVGVGMIIRLPRISGDATSFAVTLTIVIVTFAFSEGIGIGTYLKSLTASKKTDMIALAVLQILFFSRIAGILYLLSDDSEYGVPVVYDTQKEPKKKGNRYAYDGYEKHLPDDDVKE